MNVILLILLLFGNSSLIQRKCPLSIGYTTWGYVNTLNNRIEIELTINKNNILQIIEKYGSDEYCNGCFDNIQSINKKDILIMEFDDKFLKYMIIRDGEKFVDWTFTRCRRFCFEDLYNEFIGYCG